MSLIRDSRLPLLRLISLIAGWLGALGSLYFVLHTGRHNKSIFLPVLFCLWVLSPFFLLLNEKRIVKYLPDSRRPYLYGLIIAVAFISLVCYSGLFKLNNTRPAFIFLVIPALSWIVVLIFFGMAGKIGQDKK
jgi:hypothetical protein